MPQASPSLARLSPWLIILLTAIAPAFSQDDALLFNYLNNVVSPRPLFYPGDYVPVVPELAGFVLRPLPLVVQALCYRIPPAVAMLLLFSELRRFLRWRGGDAHAPSLALAVLCIFWAIEQYAWANLMTMLTPLFLVAVVYTLRLHSEARRWTLLPAAGVVLAAASIPFGILLVPVLLLHAAACEDRGRRLQNGVLALIVGVTVALLQAPVIAGMSIADSVSNGANFTHALLGGALRNNGLACASIAVVSAGVWHAWRRRGDRLVFALDMFLLAAGSLGGMLLSDRLRSNGGIGGVHLLPSVLAGLLIVSDWILNVRDRFRQALLVGAFSGAAAACVVAAIAPQLRGPLEIALMKYEFLRVAEAFRKDCRNGDGMVFEFEDSSPVVLCRPQDLPVGRHTLDSFPPAVGYRDPDAPPGERPVIVVGRPVFD